MTPVIVYILPAIVYILPAIANITPEVVYITPAKKFYDKKREPKALFNQMLPIITKPFRLHIPDQIPLCLQRQPLQVLKLSVH
jgi:hypothetical protein